MPSSCWFRDNFEDEAERLLEDGDGETWTVLSRDTELDMVVEEEEASGEAI